MEEEDKYMPADSMQQQYCSARIMSPEIVEIGEDSLSVTTTGATSTDVYVAVGKDDLHVLKWALDHVVSPGARVFLVHVFPRITYINTPVGRLARSQLNAEQVRVYINEENNRRRNLLHKYIRLCTDAKVTAETMLIESDVTAKAILDLISVLNITILVVGRKRPPYSRPLRKKLGKGEFVKKNAPDHCEVCIVHDGKKVQEGQEVAEVHSSLPSRPRRLQISRAVQRNFFECLCFSGKFDRS
ncbi:U-box domain-containing protein 33-like [Pistacia vera]|uniref:U-box domain-containing protein 33-like n=1 Tax=Pistacia vera TaxID=55513 RepID=UPI0012635ABF|nr:U-box domain-containing protein 33-like [Pistacia vera]XP_031261435.1 U-box domain-containing protein 33-like [Pistacia vera]